MADNKCGLDTDCFEWELSLLSLDIKKYTPKDFARELVRLAHTADKDACIFEAQRLDIKRGKTE